MAFFGRSFSRNRGGRNNRGRITVRHRGASRFRHISFFFPRFGAFSTYHYRPLQTSASRFLIASKTAKRRYLVTEFPFRSKVAPYRFTTNRFFPGLSTARLFTVPPGSFVNFVQKIAGGRPVFGRAPGSRVQVLRRRGSYTTIKLPSGELRRLHAKLFSFACTDEALPFSTPVYYKAGQIRHLGRRPKVRGCAMNPVDHPHGGRTGESRPSVTPWGELTKGRRTRTRPIDPKIVLRTVQQFKATRR
jgi:large subunit ribosomal protein L2